MQSAPTCNADKPESGHVSEFKTENEAWSQINKIAYTVAIPK
jgi:hypothetical protein